MLLNLKFDPEASKISEKIMFSCANHELHREDITHFKKEKLIQYIQEEDLPESIPCQTLMFLEDHKKAKIIFFNPTFILPEEVTENYFLNKNLIEQCSLNG